MVVYFTHYKNENNDLGGSGIRSETAGFLGLTLVVHPSDDYFNATMPDPRLFVNYKKVICACPTLWLYS